MKTNIDLEEELVEEALSVTGLKTKKALVNHALRELLRRHHQKKIISLKGKIHWEGDLDAMRKSRV